MSSWFKALMFTAGVFLALYSGAKAQDTFDPDKITQIVNIYEAVVQYPVASWITSENITEQFEAHRKQNGPMFLIEFIPKGEKFETWTKMLAIRGYYLPEKSLSLELMANSTLDPYLKVCGEQNLTADILSSSEEEITLLLICADSPKGDPKIGYGPGVGEVLLKTIRRYKNTYIEVYHEWRGRKFDLNDLNTWPVSKETLREMVRRFNTSIALSPSRHPPRP